MQTLPLDMSVPTNGLEQNVDYSTHMRPNALIHRAPILVSEIK